MRHGWGDNSVRVAFLLIGGLGFSGTAQAQGFYGSAPIVPSGINAVPGGFAVPGLNAPAPGPKVAPTEAPAGPPWTLVPAIELGEAYNDNVNLAPPKGAPSTAGTPVEDFITYISPSLTLTGNTARTHVYLIYDPQELLFARGTFGPQLQQRLLGIGNVEVVPQLFFFDARASIDQEFRTGVGPISPSTLTTSNNLSTVETTSASPYLLYHFNPYLNSESRYTFSTITVDDPTIAPEQIHELRQRFWGGDDVKRFGWAATADATEFDRLNAPRDPLQGTSARDEYAKLDLRYPLFASLSVTGMGGYERLHDPTLATQPSGPIWSAGLAYQPSPEFSGFASYGRRFGQTDIEASASYTPEPEIQLRGLYSLSFQTGPSLIASNLNLAAAGPNGTLINTQTGQPFTVVNNVTPGTASSAFGIISGSFFQKRLEVDAQVTRERNTYSLSAYDVKISGDPTFVTPERISGFTAGYGRQLRPELKLASSATYYRSIFENGSGEHDNTYALSVSLIYTISPTATTQLAVTRVDTSSNIPSARLVNDIVLASIRKQF